MTQTSSALQGELQSAARTLTEAEQQMTTAVKMVEQLKSESVPLLQQVAHEESALKAVEESLKQAEAIVENRREQLRPQLQLSSL